MRKFPRIAILIVLGVALIAGDCDGDGSVSTTTSATTPPTSTRDPVAAVIAALNADQAPIESQLIAGGLNALNSRWNVTGQDVENVVQGTCSEGNASWMTWFIDVKIPDSDLRALPQLEGIVNRVGMTCPPRDVQESQILAQVRNAALGKLTSNALRAALPRPQLPTLRQQVCNTLNQYEDVVSRAAGAILNIVADIQINTDLAIDLTINAVVYNCESIVAFLDQVLRELRSRIG